MGAAGVGLSGVGRRAGRGLAVRCPNRARRQFITLGWLERRRCRGAETYFIAELTRNQLQSYIFTGAVPVSPSSFPDRLVAP
jgi:hypothetical protein